MQNLFKFFSLITFCFFSILPIQILAEENLKIGLLIPMTGENEKLGQEIIKAVRLAINDIDNNKIDIILKDTGSNPDVTLKSAKELKEIGVRVVIGPVFYDSLKYLDKIEDIIFLSLTNKTINLPNNVISSGINSTSQIKTIKKFINLNNIEKTLFLIPKINYEPEIKKAIKLSKLKTSKIYSYDIEPTKLTNQIEKITNYKIRKQNLADEIYRLEKSDDPNKEKKKKNLEKRYTLGRVKYDCFVIADFDESLKSVATSLLYTDISPKKKFSLPSINGLMKVCSKKRVFNQSIIRLLIKKDLINLKKLFFKI